MKEMKRLRRLGKILTVLCLLICALTWALPAHAAAGAAGTGVYDDAGILTDAQYAALNAQAQTVREQLGGADIVIILTDDFTSSAQRELGKLGYTTSEDNVIGLVIFCQGSTYEYEIGTYGTMTREISNRKIDRIMDKIEDDIKAGNLYSGCEAFLTLTLKTYTTRRTDAWLNAALIGLVIGAVGALAATLCVVLSYRRKSRSPSYPLQDYTRLYLAVERDIFLHRTVTKVRVTSNNSGGGGPRGGGGGGGFRSSGRR
jgi:uncharacterized membrane protein YgcG